MAALAAAAAAATATAAPSASASSSCACLKVSLVRNVAFRKPLLGFRSLPPAAGHVQARVVCMVLPSGKTDAATLEKPNWAARSIKSFSLAELEARKMKYATTGTECLLMGILTEGTSRASSYLRANGITLFEVRKKAVEVNGKADMYFFSPEHPPLTEAAQRALDWAVDEHKNQGVTGEISPTLLVLGIWAQKGSPGQKVLEGLGFNDKMAEELLQWEKGPVVQRM